MKRTLLLLAALLFSLSFAFAEEPQPEISFDKTVHNFGTFSEKNPVQTCTFTFKNTGKAPLIILQAIASCGCTVPEYTEQPVAPGKTGTVKVTYDGTGRYPGHFKKIITVNSNAKQRLVRLCIEGDMTEEAKTK